MCVWHVLICFCKCPVSAISYPLSCVQVQSQSLSCMGTTEPTVCGWTPTSTRWTWHRQWKGERSALCTFLGCLSLLFFFSPSSSVFSILLYSRLFCLLALASFCQGFSLGWCWNYNVINVYLQKYLLTAADQNSHEMCLFDRMVKCVLDRVCKYGRKIPDTFYVDGERRSSTLCAR